MRASLVPILIAFTLARAAAQTADGGFADREQRYKIQPNDVIEIQFRYTPEYNLTATVQPDGYISSQIAGPVKVGGLTLAKAAALIAQQSSSRLKDPEVTVVPKDFVKPRFFVSGEVSRPGPQELRGEIGILEAIAMSGGFKESAQRSQVVLVRRVNSEVAQVHLLDVKKLMQPRHIHEQMRIAPDDLIVVPQNRISRIEPFIRVASLSMYGLAFAVR